MVAANLHLGHQHCRQWYCPICRGACEFGPQTPDRPHRVPSEELKAARDAVRRAVRLFLVRLFKAGFLSD